MNIVQNKERFIDLAKKFITDREGVDKLLNWLSNSDFFVCPASTQYNLPVEGGLCQHALNVLEAIVQDYFGKSVDDLNDSDMSITFEDDLNISSIALVALFSSIYKANCYVKDFKNVKVNGKWEQVEYWKWDEKFLYSGRGGKSVFILQQYMRLFVEEAQAIAFFLGGEDNPFSGVIDTTYKKIFEGSRLALSLHLAELRSTYLLDNNCLDT